MQKLRTYFITVGVVMALFLINPMKTNAQLPDAGCDPLDPACPIDGGLSLLIAAGIGIGAKRAYDQKKQSRENK